MLCGTVGGDTTPVTDSLYSYDWGIFHMCFSEQSQWQVMLPGYFFSSCRVSLALRLCLLSAIKTSACDLPEGNLGYSLPILQTTPSPQLNHNCFARINPTHAGSLIDELGSQILPAWWKPSSPADNNRHKTDGQMFTPHMCSAAWGANCFSVGNT